MGRTPPSPGDFESRYRDQLRLHPGSVGLVAEGDSWFAFPNVLRTNLFLELQKWSDDAASTWSLARSGDTAVEILMGQQFETLRRLFSDATLRIDGFLFSGGGNDLVAENLPNFLNTYRAGMTWMDCLNLPFLEHRLQEIANAYRRLADLRDAYKPQTHIFTHAYDWAAPSGGEVHVLIFSVGGWLKKQFLKKGVKDPALQQALVNYVLGRFGGLMEDFEAQHDRVVYVRTQGTLDQGKDWGDELHPTMDGFKKVAFKFEQSLKKVFPNLPAPSLELKSVDGKA